MYVARENARMLVQYTTAYPFRLPESYIVCVFCCQSYPDPEEFRRHMETEHQQFKVRIAFAHINEGYLKVDCTDLRCRICSEAFTKLDEAAEHLKVIHNKRISFEFDLGVQPFILKQDMMCCAICGHKSSILRMLSRHIQKHYLQCTCENCGKSYATPTSLQQHIRDSCPQTLNNQKRCRKCRKTFATSEEKRKHLESSKRCGHYTCNICGERFTYWRQKQQHLEEVHGAPKKTYTCLECGAIFNKANTLSQHFKTVHTNDYFECVSCGRKYENEYRLKRHRLVHTGEKAFTCPVCSKAFPRKSTLTQHMWIHSEVKKYECKLCDKPFNQKVSWRTHMKSRHPDLGEF